MNMKVKSVVLSMAVAVFMIAIGNCFAGRKVKYPVKLPNGYTVHFKSWGGTLEKAGMKPINLPNERNWWTKSDNDFICFMDDQDNVYVGLRWYADLVGLKLWKVNIHNEKANVVWDLANLEETYEYVCTDHLKIKGVATEMSDLWPHVWADRPTYTYVLEGHRLTDGSGRYHIDKLRRFKHVWEKVLVLKEE